MTIENKKEIDYFINNLNYPLDKYEIEKNIYSEKIELVLTKKNIDDSKIYGMQISFYSNMVDIIIINFEGDIIKNEQLIYPLDDCFPILEILIKQHLI